MRADTTTRKMNLAPKAAEPRAGDGDMAEAIAEIRMLIEAGLMTQAEASRVIERMEDAR